MDTNYTKSCLCCGKNFQKGDRIHSLDISKEWFQFMFKQEVLKLSIDHPCYMRAYHAYQASLLHQESKKIPEMVDAAVQADSFNGYDSSSTMDTAARSS